MTKATAAAPDIGEIADIGVDDLLDSWARSLRARNRSPRTIESYLQSANQLVAYLHRAGMPTVATRITREHVESFMVHLQGRVKPRSVALRYRSLQQLFRWLLEEREISADPMANMRPPHVPDQPVPVIPADSVRRLLGACEGTGFEERRDSAILTVLLDTGIRRAEAAGLRVVDVDFEHSTLLVTGKGNRQRLVPMGATTAQAIDRYLRARRRHPNANASALWLGRQGALRDTGIVQMIKRRSAQAGIPKLHAHQFRHTFAHEWISSGGTEGDLMQLGGWKSRNMLDRYGRSAAAERARSAHRKLSPADRLLGER
jgi:site-specific recombinase XerD